MALVYDPVKSGQRMTLVCFVSGTGTNYQKIFAGNPRHDYHIFTNRPDCGGAALARQNGHPVTELSHIPYLTEARKKYGAGNVPRNSPERVKYERELCRLLEERLGKEPDLICLAGFDQWVTDWMVDRYFPRMLNVHPGDTTRGYYGLHWVPSARAVIAGESELRSTLFFVDQGEDTGPVLAQSRPLVLDDFMEELAGQGDQVSGEHLLRIRRFAQNHHIGDYETFIEHADEEMLRILAQTCRRLQEQLKVKGDWEIYPFGVRLTAEGRVDISDRTVSIDGEALPECGFRLESGEK